MSGWVNFSGTFLPPDTAFIGAGSRAFRYGDGLFETMRAADGQVLLKDLHFERLRQGMAVLQIGLPGRTDMATLENEVGRTLQKNQLAGDARVRLTVFRGEGGLYEPEGRGGGFAIETWPLAPRSLNENGLVTGMYREARKSCDLLANIKSNNFLLYALAALEARRQKWNECLVLNQHERICDATTANVFWIRGETVCTTPLSEGCIAGVMRRHLLAVLPAQGWAVKEISATPADLEAADELFLTNAISGIRWIRQLNHRKYPKRLSAALYQSTF